MYLDERKRKILQAIIDDYIDTAEPIGSRTIVKRHELGLSPATIRNEMSDLEEMGYLAQPHTSAGRIPSQKGYRLYVDELMKEKLLSLDEMELIKASMEVQINEMSQLIRHASHVISKMTKYTSMSATQKPKQSSLKAVQVVPIEQGKVLVIVVTNTGLVRNNLTKVPYELTPDYIISVSNELNRRLAGLTIDNINSAFIMEIENSIGISVDFLAPILASVTDCINQIDDNEIFYDGSANIFNHPEFRDFSKAKEILNLLDERELLNRLLINNESKEGINIQIGSENAIDGVSDCSILTSTYMFGDNVLGTIGVIGPTRMEYAKVVSCMNYVTRMVNNEIKKLLERF